MKLEIEERDGIQIVKVEGRLDVNTSTGFLERVEALPALPTVLDLGGLAYLSSSGLRALHVAARHVPKLVVANLSGFCKEIYEVAGFSNVVPEHATVDAAAAALFV